VSKENILHPKEDPRWTCLSKHENDTTFDSEYQSATWSITEDGQQVGYRFFRIAQTGWNKFEKDPNWRDVLVVSSF